MKANKTMHDPCHLHSWGADGGAITFYPTHLYVGKRFETSRASSAVQAAGDENWRESTQGGDSRRPRDGED